MTRAVRCRDVGERRLQTALGVGVDRRRGLVEDQETGRDGQGAGHGHELHLSE